LPPLFEGSDLHAGIFLALLSVLACDLWLWHTTSGFRIRLLGSSDKAAAYAGVSVTRTILSVMGIAGALSGIAGAVEVLGVHYRLIQGFSQGFGFNAVAVALHDLAERVRIAADVAGQKIGIGHRRGNIN